MDGWICEDCQKFAYHAFYEPAKWKPRLDDLCSLLGSNGEKQCLNLVDNSEELKKKDPLDFCLETRLCQEDMIDAAYNSTTVGRPVKQTDNHQYKICTSLVKLAKDNKAQEAWKIYVEPGCKTYGEEDFVDECKKTANAYLEDLGKLPELDFCKKFNLVDMNVKSSSGHIAQGNHTVCSYLVGLANYIGSPTYWAYSFRDYCSNLDSVYGFGLCEVTVYKNMRDFQEDPAIFCSEHNLINV